jgi:drug/metabolite transporter (DMT)-like permease
VTSPPRAVPSSPSAAGAPSSAPAAAHSAPAAAPPEWKVWSCLWIVYVVWGSTYLAIRVMVETMPPLLGAGARFVLAGAAMVAVLAVRRGPAAVRLDLSQLASALAIGTLLMGANAVVSVAEREVPSALAALLIASVPLWVILLRRALGERVMPASVGAVAVGFAGVALLMAPGEQTAGASLAGLLAVVAAACMWATGSVASPRVTLPRDPLLSTGWQMLLGGLVCVAAGLAAGEARDVEPDAFSTRSIVAFAYLVVFGSWVAFTAYAWLLQNAPLSKVATYAYVNPVVAIALGWLILDEAITPLTLIGATVIVVSVAMVVRLESARRARPAGEPAPG